MPGLRAIAGYMDAWVDADENERNKMLEEMRTLLQVGQGISGMQQTRQAMEIAGAKESRAQQMFPTELGLNQIAVDAAVQALLETRSEEEYKRQERPYILGQEAARETTMSAQAGLAPRAEEARTRQLEVQLSQTEMNLEEAQRTIQRMEQARTKLAAEGMPTAEEAALRAGIAKPLEEAAVATARIEARVPQIGAEAAAREEKYKAALNASMLKMKYAPQMLQLTLDKMMAEIDKLRQDAQVKALGGKSPVDYRNDLIKEIASMTEVIAKVRMTPTLENVIKALGGDINHPFVAMTEASGVDPSNVTPALEGHINALKSFLLIDFGLNYDKLAEVGRIDFSKLPMGIAPAYMIQFPGAVAADALRTLGGEPGTLRGEPGLPPGPRTLPTPQTPATGTQWEALDINTILDALEQAEE